MNPGPVRRRHARRRRFLPWVVVVGLLAGGVLGCGNDDGDSAGPALPGLTLPAASSGPDLDLGELGDRPSAVNLWATWCTPCRDELPDLDAVHRALGDQVRIIGVNVGDDADDVIAFLAEVDVGFEQYRDPESAVSAALGIVSLPATIFVDAEGAVVEVVSRALDQAEIEATLDRLFGVVA